MKKLKSIQHPEFTMIGILMILISVTLVLATVVIGGFAFDTHDIGWLAMGAVGVAIGILLLRKSKIGTLLYFLLFVVLLAEKCINSLPSDSIGWMKFILGFFFFGFYGCLQVEYHKKAAEQVAASDR